ncbi:CPBP family intramembrane metalloprotease [Clostridium sp. D2Q-11]|uniref:CPBP family intramembrane metalloprotease n=1 Tax=Anaeromonas frigoriresistens TaxID=2683708 RepID=A0A942UUT0_9FIRM|nr:type II CAAX endopeptidase family protein [Anaeromonas frigoriresistens]MBS4538978.1 CPBP family intramembrane metalloprotease [Anaeromonas frigoriresistens]
MKSRRTRIIAFIGITYLLTILFHILLKLLGGQSNPFTINLLGIPMLFPFVAVLMIQRTFLKEKLKSYIDQFLKPNCWFLYALLIPILMALFVNMLGIILFESNIIGIKGAIKILVVNIALGVSIAAGSAFFEEVGWRDFLYKELKHVGVIKSSILTGIVWAVWHMPVVIGYKYADSLLKGLIINTLQLFILSLIISYIRYKSGSVIAASIIHGMINTLFLSSYTIFFSTTDVFDVEWIRILAGFLVLAIILIYKYIKKKREQGLYFSKTKAV